MFIRSQADPGRHRRSAPDFRARLLLEVLEGRIAAATFTVTNASDSGAGSLRQAILDANATTPSADTIAFGPLFNTAQTITLASSMPDVTDALTINGPGASLLTVRRDPANTSSFRIIRLTAPTTLSGMTLSGGRTAGTAVGGAIVIEGTGPMTIMNSVISGNSATAGGGVSLQGTGPMTIMNSVISGNSASVGGGISVFGNNDLTIRNSTISGNSSAYGGGVYSGGDGNLLVENCTISGNSSSIGGGGGLYLYGSQVTAAFRNSTISGNTAHHGGGAAFFFNTGNLSFQNSTVVGNAATSSQGGGGIWIAQFVAAPVLSVTSTVVANNASAGGTGADILGAVISNFSLIRNQAGATITGSNNLAAGTDPMLGPLASNGGPTQTMAVLGGSPLINAGSNPASLSTDQRGAQFDRAIGAAADIGAFELQSFVQSVEVNAGQANTTQRSIVTSVTVTFGRVVSFEGAPGNAFRLSRIGPGAPTGDVNLGIEVTPTATQTIVRLTFSGGLTEGSASVRSLVDGNYTLTVRSSQILGGLSGGDTVSTFYRLFGDANGDKAVNGLDLAAFRNTFGNVSTDAGFLPFFDFDGDGAINGLDLAQFRLRFGVILP